MTKKEIIKKHLPERKKTKLLTMKEYCPQSPYGWTLQDIIQQVVQKEDDINHNDTQPQVIHYVRKPNKKKKTLYKLFLSILP